MRRAQELLETTFLSVKEIMAKVGVTDESHFVRDFKRFHGCTPAQYRARFHDNQPVAARHARPQLSTLLASAVRSRLGGPKRSATAAVPPLLIRRPSYPQHLVEDKSPLRRTQKLKDALSLLMLRHVAFAELTTQISAKIARGMVGARSIIYRARPHASLSRRLPPAAEPRRLSPPQPPRSIS